MPNTRLWMLAPSIALLYACQTPPVVDPGKEISVEAALASIGRGFANMYAEQFIEIDEKRVRVPTGLVASEASIVLNLKASAENSNKLVIDLARTLPEASEKIGGSIGGSSESKEVTERGNVITIKMVSSLDRIGPKSTVKECVTKPDKTETCKTTVVEGKSIDTLKQWSRYLSDSQGGGVFSPGVLFIPDGAAPD